MKPDNIAQASQRGTKKMDSTSDYHVPPKLTFFFIRLMRSILSVFFEYNPATLGWRDMDFRTDLRFTFELTSSLLCPVDALASLFWYPTDTA